MAQPLGQHFLEDHTVIDKIIEAAELNKSDVVLEIGPGKGILTNQLIEQAGNVIAVEKDGDLHHKLKKRFRDKNNVEFIHKDIREFDLAGLPSNYKLVANIPYYLTGKIIRSFLENNNPPVLMVLLVQEEVARRLTAPKGNSSLLQLTAQLFSEIEYIQKVDKTKFSPPPKVDSAVIRFKIRQQALIAQNDQKRFFRFLKAGFAGKRKKITNTLSGSLGISREDVAASLRKCNLGEDVRPQHLDINEWICVFKDFA